VPAAPSTGYTRAVAESMGEELRLGWSQASRVAAASLAGGLGQQPVPRRFERCAAANLLCDLGVASGQGYAFGRPARAESLLSARYHW
jgi:hypothetical protein